VGLLALAGGGESDGGNEVDEFAEALFVVAGVGVVLGEDAFEAQVVALDADHDVVHDLAAGGLLPWARDGDQWASASTQKTFSALY
jgi:hypothetical protein